MAKLKVFGITLMIPKEFLTAEEDSRNPQRRCIVATTSQKKAAWVLGTSLNHLRDYGSETGNEVEIKIAMAKPGAVFFQKTFCGVPKEEDYVEIPKTPMK